MPSRGYTIKAIRPHTIAVSIEESVASVALSEAESSGTALLSKLGPHPDIHKTYLRPVLQNMKQLHRRSVAHTPAMPRPGCDRFGFVAR